LVFKKKAVERKRYLWHLECYTSPVGIKTREY